MSLWSSEQLLVTVSGPEGRREIVVPRPFARIGTHPESEIVLSAPGVAKRSHYVHATREGLFCLDLDVEDSVPEKRGRWLDGHDALQIGPYLLTFRGGQANQGRPQLPRRSPGAAPRRRCRSSMSIASGC